MSVLEIKNLHVNVETDQGTSEILRGVDLVINEGEIHAIMGPNGSGKSTLAYTIAGHPKYQVVQGEILLDGEDVLEMTVDARARAGLFLAMQYPVEIPGVTITNFLRTAKTAIDGEAPSIRHWVKDVRESMANLSMDSAFAERNVNEGFSGGEKKRNEILQLELLKPRFAVLDETDSGLDVDALQGRLRGRQPRQGEHRPRHPAHHALHAHPPLHHARLRARVRRRAGSPSRAAASWPTASRRRATTATRSPRRPRPSRPRVESQSWSPHSHPSASTRSPRRSRT